MNTYTKTENQTFIVVHVFYDDKTSEIKTLSELALKRFKKSKKYKKVLSLTKLQELHLSIKIKIHPEGFKLK